MTKTLEERLLDDAVERAKAEIIRQSEEDDCLKIPEGDRMWVEDYLNIRKVLEAALQRKLIGSKEP